jgi:hypothetical protein
MLCTALMGCVGYVDRGYGATVVVPAPAITVPVPNVGVAVPNVGVVVPNVGVVVPNVGVAVPVLPLPVPWPNMYFFGGGYERGPYVHHYSRRGADSRAIAHPGGGERRRR